MPAVGGREVAMQWNGGAEAGRYRSRFGRFHDIKGDED